MLSYTSKPFQVLKGKFRDIPSFLEKSDSENIDWKTVDSFGEEWERFNSFSEDEISKIGSEYFDIVPLNLFRSSTAVLDVGCGTGRWTHYLASKVGSVEAIDPSKAVLMAEILLKEKKNVRVTQASVDKIPFEDNTFDLVFSLGVLHHIPDTFNAMKKCVEKVKPGGYFLVYLYYNLDNRGPIFKVLFFLSNLIRRFVCLLPKALKNITADLLAVGLYMPFVLLAKVWSKIPLLNKFTNKIPLSYYRNKSFKVIRNDSLDRFGTPLEQRFSKKEIEKMMKNCGLTEIQFSSSEPYWHAIGRKI